MKTCFGLFKILLHPHLFLKRSNPFIFEAARVDQREVIQVGIYIQSKTVHGDKTAAFHTDRTKSYGLFSVHQDQSTHLVAPASRFPFNAIDS